MKMRAMLVLPLAVLALAIGAACGQDESVGAASHPELKAYPPAEEGMQRLVIVLPQKERGEEDAFRVELVAGKVMETDGVNRVRLDAKIADKVVQGWGYTYYQVSGSDRVMSTLIGVPEGAKRVKKFVAGEPLLVRYNSRLPVVIYAPDGFEVRYRIWRPPPELRKVKKG